jgi:predicted DNA-binding transcriptional regulator YafY
MPLNKDFYFRLEILDECLRNRYRNWTLLDLINKVSERLLEHYNSTASKRTIQGDLKYLKEEKLAPIEKKKNGSITYFYYSDPNYSIKNLPVKEEEINFLKDAINILRQVNDFKILQDIEDIVTKLQNTVSTNIEGRPLIIQFEKHTTALGTEHIDCLFTAIKEKVVLRVSYQPFNAEQIKEYIFHPYLLKEYRNRWFVYGRKETRSSITIFALDRIKKIKNSNEEYIANDLFVPETYFKNLIGVTIPENEAVQTIEIKIARKQVPYIKTKPIHNTQEIVKEYKTGDILIRLQLISNYELKSVLFGYGADIEVIKPTELRESMKKELKNAILNYGY